MDFSKLKLEVYDFLGILVPGLVFVCDCWIFVRGWPHFLDSLASLSGNLVAALLIVSYITGHLVQEAGDLLVHALTKKRYLSTARDKLWSEREGAMVKAAILKEAGIDVASVDVAFDYCLTRVKELFAKRDAFVATSDLARSLVFLVLPTGISLLRIETNIGIHGWRLGAALTGTCLMMTLTFFIAWRRMMRFRAFSDLPVFAAYLAHITHDSQQEAARTPDSGKSKPVSKPKEEQ
jgi:hypothetical protein